MVEYLKLKIINRFCWFELAMELALPFKLKYLLMLTKYPKQLFLSFRLKSFISYKIQISRLCQVLSSLLLRLKRRSPFESTVVARPLLAG